MDNSIDKQGPSNGGANSRNGVYTDLETKIFLEIVEHVLPICTPEWNQVAAMYENYGLTPRRMKSLRNKFKALAGTTGKTGNPFCCQFVKHAKKIEVLMTGKTGMFTMEKAPFGEKDEMYQYMLSINGGGTQIMNNNNNYSSNNDNDNLNKNENENNTFHHDKDTDDDDDITDTNANSNSNIVNNIMMNNNSPVNHAPHGTEATMISNNHFIVPQQATQTRKRKGNNDGIMDLLRAEILENKVRDKRLEDERIRRDEQEEKHRVRHEEQQQQIMQLVNCIMLQNKATTNVAEEK